MGNKSLILWGKMKRGDENEEEVWIKGSGDK